MSKKTLFFASFALTLFACSGSDDRENQMVPGSSGSSSSDPSSSSGSSTPPEIPCTVSNPSGEDLLSISYSGLCAGFNPNAEIEHFGKMKKRICDERDGTKYFYVPIGRQIWLAENLKFNAEGTMGRCFRDDPENCNTLGVMYTFQEMFCRDASGCLVQKGVVDPGKLDEEVACPYGWHLPSTRELEELFAYSDPDFVPGSEASGTGGNSAATKLKVTGWGDGTDEFGFSALPSGYCGDGCPQNNPNWYTLYPGQKTDPIRSTFWWHKGFGSPVPLTKSWHIKEAATVDDAYQSYGTSRFYTRCVKNVSQQSVCPETPPQALTCSGSGTARQKCHYGKWKDYFIDGRDGKEYPQEEIDGKTWMAANLNYAAESGSVCYNNLEANCTIYDRLYDYATASGSACPRGWHLPSDEEWTALTAAVGGTGIGKLIGAGTILKTKSGWVQNGKDYNGFAALPGGYGISSTLGFGTARGGFWWSATTQAANGAIIRHIGPASADVKSVDNDKSRLYSVRCVKDKK